MISTNLDGIWEMSVKQNTATSRLIFCSGMPRSASTWSYNVCRLLLQQEYGAENIFAGYVGEGRNLDVFLNSDKNSKTARLLKFHYPSKFVTNLVVDGAAKNIYTIRHPFDAIASAKEFFQIPFEKAMAGTKQSLEIADIWREKSDSLFIHFDEIMADPKHHIRRIAKYLALRADDSLIDRILDETSFQRTKITAENLANLPKDQLVRAGSSYYDKETLLHIGHYTKGDTRTWQNELTADERRIAEDELKPWLTRWMPPDNLA